MRSSLLSFKCAVCYYWLWVQCWPGLEHWFILLNRNFIPVDEYVSISPLPLPLLVITIPVFDFMILPLLNISSECNHAVLVYMCLAYFRSITSSKFIHVVVYCRTSFLFFFKSDCTALTLIATLAKNEDLLLFEVCIVFHCMDPPHFLDLFIC